MTDPALRIDIVIPCAGRVADLLRLLDSLQRCCADSLSRYAASITVTDDRPSQALLDQLAQAYPQVRYLHGPARGPAANRNNGAHLGTAPWLLFLDDDCYVESDVLAAYAGSLAANPEADVFEGAIHPIGERPNGNHHAPLNLSGGKLWSCNLMMRRSTFNAVAGFDERFPFACMEDVDLAERLAKAGCTSVFAPAAQVLHPWRSQSERELTRQLISHAIYADKHPPFTRQWGIATVLRMVKGRATQYASRSSATIPWLKYRTVAYDLVLPFALLAVVRVPSLRASLCERYRNRLNHETPLLVT
jgi:GT2 family glycosyltransferase